jgi:putative ABC transport system permease protein
MLRIALFSLIHDRGKLMAAIAGVAFASTLILVQAGIYAGFLDSASAMIRKVGGDVWLMAKGTEVIDEGETLSVGTKAVALRHPCVKNARGVILTWARIRKANGAFSTSQVVAAEDGSLVPWSMARGLPRDIEGPMRVAVDTSQLKKLQIQGDPMGAPLEANGLTMYVSALTSGIHSFTLMPFLFTSVATARRVTFTADGRFTYLVLDLAHPSCEDEVVRYLRAERDLHAMTTKEFALNSESYWVGGSGAGTALAFGALLGLIVGIAIVGQTLYSVTKEHLTELATLKALGASRARLVGFVVWQAAFLCLIGELSGIVMAIGVREVVAGFGLKVILSQTVLAVGATTIALMCVVASATSVLRVLHLEVAEVFK